MYNRELKHINETIQRLSICLQDKTVLTEIGNNYYFFLPFIAALSGAKKVYAWTSDNPHFDCKQVVKEAELLSIKLNLENVIEFAVNKKPVEHIRTADIITNSGFIRPIDKTFLNECKKNVSIPLMYEAWEVRNTDIDIEFCKHQKINVAGTNENHPSINVFESVGPLAIKLAHEAGMEVFQNNILIWSDDEFGTVTEKYFYGIGAKKVVTTCDKKTAIEFIKEAHFIYFCRNHEKRTLISNSAEDRIFSIDEIKQINPDITIVHLYGKLSYSELTNAQLKMFPKQDGKTEYMSKTLNHIGMIPTLNLFCAGFKVGEEVSNNKLSTLTQLIQ